MRMAKCNIYIVSEERDCRVTSIGIRRVTTARVNPASPPSPVATVDLAGAADPVAPASPVAPVGLARKADRIGPDRPVRAKTAVIQIVRKTLTKKLGMAAGTRNISTTTRTGMVLLVILVIHHIPTLPTIPKVNMPRRSERMGK
jgi:hypothetical protein